MCSSGVIYDVYSPLVGLVETCVEEDLPFAKIK